MSMDSKFKIPSYPLLVNNWMKLYRPETLPGSLIARKQMTACHLLAMLVVLVMEEPPLKYHSLPAIID